MNPKNTWLLVVIAAGLFAFIYFVERGIKPPAPVDIHVWSGMDTNLVTAIEIAPQDAPAIRVERTNGVWRMTRPVAYAVENYEVNRFLHALADLSAHSRLTAKDLQGQKDVNHTYGFDTPRYSVLIEQGDDKYILNLGNRTAPGDEIFAQVVGSDTDGVDLIGLDFLKYLPANAEEWQDKTFASLNDLNVDKLTVLNAGGTLTFLRDLTNNRWTMTDPTRSAADNNGINILLNQALSARVARFVHDNPPQDPAAYGLQPPQVELKLFDGTNVVTWLQFGKSANDSNEVYARAGPQAPVVLLERGLLDRWREGPNFFRDTNLAALTAAQWESLNHGFSIDVTSAQNRTNFSVWSDTNGVIWVTDTNQEIYAADSNACRYFLTQLVTMTITAPYASNSQVFAVKDVVQTNDWGDFGLAASNLVRRYQINVVPPGGTPALLAQLNFGWTNTNADGSMFFRRGHVAEDAVYAVRTADFERLPARALDLRLRRIWTFAAADVAQIAVSTNGKTLTLEHRGIMDWSLADTPGSRGVTTPEKEAGTEGVVEELLGALEAQRWVGRADKDPPPEFGFSDLSLQIELTFKNGETRRINFGGPARGGGHYASVSLEGHRWIFVFSARDWADLSGRLWMPDP